MLFFLIFSTSLVGQTDTLSLESILVIAPPIRNDNLGGNSTHWNSQQLQHSGAQNLSELLQQNSGSFIKSYGLGSLATSAIRGGNAGHTQVLWNGLPIHSPMLGLVDFALLPLAFTDQVRFSRGGNTALWGSGSIGGVINLENTMDLAQQFSLTATSTMGSFGHFQQNLRMDIGLGNWFSTTRLLHLQAANDFSYTVAPTLPQQKLTNAAVEQRGLQQSFYITLPKRQSIAAHLWLQTTDRQIPPKLAQNQSLSYEKDQATRLMLDYKNFQQFGKTNIKLGFSREDIDFFDDIQNTTALSYFTNWITEISQQYTFRKHHTFFAGSTHTLTHAEADGYTDGRKEYRGALFASYRWKKAGWSIQANFRQGWVEEELIPFVPTLAAEGRLRDWLMIKAKVSRNYRLPTLNDRYWQPGGNPDLLPEQGWSGEATLQSQWQHQRFFWRYALTGFNRYIDDWILWSRPEGKQFWSSFNVAEVWSRGMEQRASLSYLTKQLDVKLKLGYDYIRSTNQVALELPLIAEGSQLWYVPEHQWSGQLAIRWKKISWNYQHQWTGNYTGTAGPLTGYQTASTRLQYDGQWQQLSGFAFVQLYNLWNEDYQVIERRPMPGRYFRAGLNIKFTK